MMICSRYIVTCVTGGFANDDMLAIYRDLCNTCVTGGFANDDMLAIYCDLRDRKVSDRVHGITNARPLYCHHSVTTKCKVTRHSELVTHMGDRVSLAKCNCRQFIVVLLGRSR
jgi:hypothetical protein